MSRGLAWILGVSLVGCASTSPKSSFEQVSQLVEARTGHPLRWRTGGPEDEAVGREVQALLGRELTVEVAVQVALLNNRDLLATYEDLGVAQADLVQAGLLRNPSLGASVRFPSGGGHLIDSDFSVVEDFLDLFVLPLRKRLAEADLRAAQFRVGSKVLGVAAQVKEAFYRFEAAEQIEHLRQSVAEAEAAAAELNRRQHDAGNIGELEFVTQQALDQQARLDLVRSAQEREEASEQLARLLGIGERSPEWRLASTLANLPVEDAPVAPLAAVAALQRLDLRLAQSETEALEKALSLARTTRWFGVLQFGASTERDPEGARVTGPEVVLEVPLFDQRQAAIARLEALTRAQRDRQASLEMTIRSEVRLTSSRMLAARVVAERYRTVLLPLREQAVALSQQHYNAMLLGVYGLLQAKQSEVNARREYLEAMRDYWVARAELERALGGRLPLSATAAVEVIP